MTKQKLLTKQHEIEKYDYLIHEVSKQLPIELFNKFFVGAAECGRRRNNDDNTIVCEDVCQP